MKTLVIAEPGCTHEGDLAKMFALVKVAADCGSDVIKFQWTSDPELMCRRRNAPGYLKYYRWLAFPESWHAQLAAECAKRKLAYGCTVYIPGDVAVVAPHVAFYKVSSFEASSPDMLKACLGYMTHDAKRLIVSLGLGAEAKLVRELATTAELQKRVDLLHCVSAYPTPDADLNLRRIAVEGLDGYSDHASPQQAISGALAVALGARIVERHLRLLSADQANPDVAVAMTPPLFAQYVTNVRAAEAMSSAYATTLTPAERTMLPFRVGGGSTVTV